MIFGNFDEIPPAEALTVVGAETGTFISIPVSGPKFEVFLDAGFVVAMRVGDEAIEDPLRLHSHFSELLRLRLGEFDFQRSPASTGARKFRLPLVQLITAGLASADEIFAEAHELPSAESFFELDRALDLWLGDELQLFWERAEPLLRFGSSAEEIAAAVPLPVDRVRWYLFKLRMAGLIRPRRLSGDAAPSPRPRPQLQKLLPPRAEVPAASPAEPESGLESVVPRLRDVQVAEPPKPLLLRLIHGLTAIFR